MTVTSRNPGDLLSAPVFNTKIEAPVTTGEINDGAITTAKIADGNVTGAKLATQPSARVTHAANQSIANATSPALAFDTERWDTDGLHDTATNNTRLTCQTAGKYLIVGQARFDTGGGTRRDLIIHQNGTTTLAQENTPPVSGTITDLIIVTLADLAAGDYVELLAYQDSGSSLSVLAQPNLSPEFSLIRIGP